MATQGQPAKGTLGRRNDRTTARFRKATWLTTGSDDVAGSSETHKKPDAATRLWSVAPPAGNTGPWRTAPVRRLTHSSTNGPRKPLTVRETST